METSQKYIKESSVEKKKNRREEGRERCRSSATTRYGGRTLFESRGKDPLRSLRGKLTAN